MTRAGGWAGGALAGAVAATLLSVLFLDRPAALWSHAVFGRASPFVALTHLVDPLPPAALLAFLGIGTAQVLGWRPPRPVRVAFAISVATLLAVVVKDQLKFAFGRTWPETWVDGNPSLIHDGVMLFAPFHGRTGWTSFPSGHTALATAPMAALILHLSTPWRWLCALPALLVAVGLYGADFHFIGDILAGATVGVLCAVIATRMLAHGTVTA